MNSPFSRAMSRLNRAAITRLSDSSACYYSPQGPLVAKDLKIMLDSNLEMAGAEGAFITDAVGVTWQASELHGVQRNGLFQVGLRRLLVDRIIANDGQWITAACMEQK